MGFYQRFFASFMAHGDDAQHKLLSERKRALFAGLEGAVAEIGPGTGINLPYYTPAIRWIGFEPNHYMHPYIRAKAVQVGMEIDLRDDPAEAMTLDDESVDAVVSTLVLCSVADQRRVFSEIRRVLKPGGRFLFIEHVAAPDGSMLRHVQRWIKPLWRRLGDGCRPDRHTGAMLERAGFGDLRYEHFDVPLPIVRPHIIGMATKAG